MTFHDTVLFYQDVNEQFEGYTQLYVRVPFGRSGCFIRMSMNNLKDIHNLALIHRAKSVLFYQDVNEQFEGYTQRSLLLSCVYSVVLSGFQ